MSQMVTTVSRMDTSESIARQVAVELRAAMASAGVSQRDMAAETGIPLVTLSRRLTGTGKGFTLDEVAMVASVLGLGLTEVVLRAERAMRSAAA